MKSRIARILLFVFCGIPGVFVFIFSAVFLVAKIIDPGFKGPENKLLLAGTAAVGIFLTLLGVGKLNQPLYAVVFMVIPLAGFMYELITPYSGTGYGGFALFIGVACFVVLYAVRRYYQKLDSSNEDGLRGS